MFNSLASAGNKKNFPPDKLGKRGLPATFWGFLAALVLGFFYLALVGLASRSLAHALELFRDDRYYILAILAGFGVQVGLMVRLRRALRGAREQAGKAVGAAGTGASTLSMLACCAHHVSDLAPLLAGSGLVLFLGTYRYQVMLAGIAVNLAGIILMLRRMARLGIFTLKIKAE